MSRVATIVLGGREFTVRPLTLGQYEDNIDVLRAAQQDRGNITSLFALYLARDYPEMTVEALRELETGPAEATAAITALMSLSGFQRSAPTGEAPGE